ncbi:MAG: DinB family protein [Candidatus Krumholzibacteria bacterium]|nr:DinB family protein [Candidatus Krumholzibacteria bacterium]
MSEAIKTLSTIFKFDDSLFFEKIASLEDGVTVKTVSGQANPILWLAGHLLNSRRHMLELLGTKKDLQWAPFIRSAYDASTEYPKMSDIKETWSEISGQLFEALDQVSDEDLDRKLDYELPHGDNTVRGSIIFWAYHEAWHLGQIAYIRKCIGMEGLVPY